jgi:hypothetical protein
MIRSLAPLQKFGKTFLKQNAVQTLVVSKLIILNNINCRKRDIMHTQYVNLLKSVD